MNRAIHLNVGGTQFVTTAETLQSCQHFEGALEQSELFLDRDPDVFRRALKVLRGYPCDELADDHDVISELAWLKHPFATQPLPDWLDRGVRAVETNDTDHTLDPEQTARFSRSRVMVATESMERLSACGVLCDDIDDYPKCRVVGVSKGWVDSQWVPIHDFEVAKLKLRFLRHFLPHSILDEGEGA